METPAIPRHTLKFRNEYREQSIPPGFRGRGALLALSVFCFAGMLIPLLFIRDLRWSELWIVPLSFLHANLMEYLGHRWPMHKKGAGPRAMFESHALRHHRFLTDQAMAIESPRDLHVVLMKPQTLFFFLVLLALPHALACYFFISPNSGLLVLSAAFVYYCNYEILHTIYHLDERHWLLRPKFMRFLYKHHAYHHDPKLMNHYNFNVSYPIWDLLFGSFYRSGAGSGRDDRRSR